MDTVFNYKQAIVVRLDLKMGKGKIAVQCAHAAVSASELARKYHNDWWKRWLSEGQKKVVLKVKDEGSLHELMHQAEVHELPAYLVQDKGLTQIPADTVTCIGIGPGPSGIIDRLTGQLALL